MVGEGRKERVIAATAPLPSRRGARLAAAALLLAIGCRGPREDSQTPRATASTAALGSVPPEGPATAASAPPLPLPPLPDGCHGPTVPTEPDAAVAHLVTHCAPGTEALVPPGPLPGEGARRSLAFEVEHAPTCLRAVVATDARGPVRARLHGPSGTPIAESALPASFAVVAPRGPVCVAEAGRFELVVEAEGSTSAVATIRAGAEIGR